MSGAKIEMGASRTVRSANKLKKFRLLNWLFWLCWLGLPVMIGIAYWTNVNNVPWAIANATPEEAKCLRIFPRSLQFFPRWEDSVLVHFRVRFLDLFRHSLGSA